MFELESHFISFFQLTNELISAYHFPPRSFASFNFREKIAFWTKKAISTKIQLNFYSRLFVGRKKALTC
jgi:hypothetical protein